MAKAPLRAVAPGERRPEPLSLEEAVKAGDVLEMLLAQRRLIADSLTNAAASVRPQLNNELNKLHALIREEQMRRESAKQEGDERGPTADEAWSAV